MPADLVAALAALDLPALRRPWALDGDALIVGDVHAPFTDPTYARRAALVAQRYLPRPRQLIINGDLLDMGNFSTWAAVVQQPTWGQERDACRALLDNWLETFDAIWIVMGNHERRLQKFSAAALDETDILALLRVDTERIRWNGYGWCTLRSGGETWRITHPRNYGINQLTVGDQLAQKYNCHVWLAHEHHLAVGWDRYKRHMVVNGGCLVDPRQLAYVQLDDSKSAGMARGFGMIRAGSPYLFGEPPFTDWSWYE